MSQLNLGMIFGTLLVMGISWSVAATVDNGVTLAEIRTIVKGNGAAIEDIDLVNLEQSVRINSLERAVAVLEAQHEADE